MNNQQITSPADKEMNFFDLCVAIGRAIGRLCVACWRLLSRMIRLTYRYWWLVLTLVVLAVAAAIYHTRTDNVLYRVNAVAFINGASVPQFEQAFAPIMSGRLLPENTRMGWYLSHKQAQRFSIYRIVDAKGDGTPDYIDFKRKSNPKDTVLVQMQDRVCIQFCTPSYAIPLVPEIEAAILEVLNGNPSLQQSYEVYRQNLAEEVAFNHRQSMKLDSLTSAYYYNAGSVMPMTTNGNAVNYYGDRKIRLFLNDIYNQQQRARLYDYKMQLATAPVVLENHFAVSPKPVHSRMECVIIFFLLGWIVGCLLAEGVDRRKEIISWLKQ